MPERRRSTSHYLPVERLSLFAQRGNGFARRATHGGRERPRLGKYLRPKPRPSHFSAATRARPNDSRSAARIACRLPQDSPHSSTRSSQLH